jgi:integrase
MASLRRRSASWQVRVSRKGCAAIVKTFKTKAQAEQWGRAQEHALDMQIFTGGVPTIEMNFGDLVQRYLTSVTPSKRGRESEALRLKAILRREICRKPVSELTILDTAKYRDERLQCVSSGTVHREFRLLMHVWAIAKREWMLMLGSNPFADVRLPQLPPARQRVLNKQEWNALQIHARETRTPWLLSLMQLAYSTAMRRSEILALKWSEVDLEKKYLLIRKSKSGHSRLLPLTDQAAETLLNWKNESGAETIFNVTPNALRLAFGRLCKRAGIEDFHWHDFRHCATSNFAEMGLSPVELMALTGHRQLGSLMRYAHVGGGHLHEKIRHAKNA